MANGGSNGSGKNGNGGNGDCPRVDHDEVLRRLQQEVAARIVDAMLANRGRPPK